MRDLCSRECPVCDAILNYCNKYACRDAEIKNTSCRSCSMMGKSHSQTDETKRKISKSLMGNIPWNVGKNLTPEHKRKISISHTGKQVSEETKKKLSEMRLGNALSKETKRKISKAHKGKKFTSEHKKKLSERKMDNVNALGYKHTDDAKKQMSKMKKDKSLSTEHKKKLRLATIKSIEARSGQVYPNYNPSSVPIIEQYGKENGYNFQHAENGGEHHIKELGYWVDGYDKDKNVVIEYDEKHHFNSDGSLKEKDIQRQLEITKYLKCEFVRLGDKYGY